MVPDKKSLGGIGDPKCTIAPSDQTLVHRSAQVPLSRRLQGAGSAQSVVTAATTVKGPLVSMESIKLLAQAWPLSSTGPFTLSDVRY